MNTTTILSSVAEGASADKRPAIGSPGGLCSTLFSHRPVNLSVHQQIIRVTEWTAEWFPADHYTGDPPQWLGALDSVYFRRHRQPLDFWIDGWQPHLRRSGP